MLTEKTRKVLKIAGIITASFIVLCAAAIGAFEGVYAERTFPGLKIGEVDVGGATYPDLVRRLDDYQALLNANGVEFRYQEDSFKLLPTVYAGEADIANNELFLVDINKTAEDAYGIGRTGSWWKRGKDQLATLIGRRTPSARVYMQTDEVVAAVHNSFGEYESPAVNAQVVAENDGTFRAEPHTDGEAFLDTSTLSAFHRTLAQLSSPTITLALAPELAKVRTEDIEQLIPEIQQFANRAPITLTYGEKTWTVERPVVAQWFTIQTSSAASSVDVGATEPSVLAATEMITLDSVRIGEYLRSVAGEIEREARNGKYEMRDGQAVEFQAPQTGVEIDAEETTVRLREVLWDSAEQTERRAEIASIETPPDVTTENIGDLGMTQILGTGYTNFAGSGANRIHNVKLGASRLHGILIAPGEEFSTLEVMDGFQPKDGWKEGYVIKGDRTVPEYGGGACQFGTTLFRATLASGLPVTDRAAHSYIVSYYYDENGDPGKDATIYDPGRDYRFVNDTGNYVLIQSRIVGFNFYIDFWGTPDGRRAEQTDVRTWNWVPAPPSQTIETDELAPGERNCIEHARPGANTAFDYSVTYADGRTSKDTFSSKYKAWPEVCMVGKQSPPAPAQ